MNARPAWFHHNGEGRLVPQPISQGRQELILLDTYGNVTVSIRRLQNYTRGRNFQMRWKIPHVWGDTSGKMQLAEDDINRMFGIDEPYAPTEPVRYIREGQCLNVPGKNCNGDGDPNLSIFVSDEIKEAMKGFLASLPQLVS